MVIVPLTEAQAELMQQHEWCALLGVRRFLRIYRGAFSRDELSSAAFAGLLRAAQKYDPAKGARFSTYAFYWITRNLRRVRIDAMRADGWVYCDGGKRLRRRAIREDFETTVKTGGRWRANREPAA